MAKRCCANCVYGVLPEGRWFGVILRRWPGLRICINGVEAPGRMREVGARGRCRNFLARRWPRGKRVAPPRPRRDDVRYIPLTRGMYAIVDAEDFEELNRHKWTLVKRGNSLYAGRREKGRYISMHREIMKTPEGMVVDHINGNGLNNRKCNMRNCTKAQNSYNSRPRGGASSYVGVTYHKRSRKYVAVLGHNGKKVHVGEFDTSLEAARARDRVARELQGEFAYLNFPEAYERAGRIISLAGSITVRSRVVGTLTCTRLAG